MEASRSCLPDARFAPASLSLSTEVPKAVDQSRPQLGDGTKLHVGERVSAVPAFDRGGDNGLHG